MAGTSNRLSFDELKETSEYQRLTLKQRLFVATYCETGIATGRYEPIKATYSAYQCKSMEVARVMSYSLMGNINVVAALNHHFGRAPVDIFLAQVGKALRRKSLTMAQVAALKLYADIAGYGTGLPVHGEAPYVMDAAAADVAKQAVIDSRKPKKTRKTKGKPERPPPDGYKNPLAI